MLVHFSKTERKNYDYNYQYCNQTKEFFQPSVKPNKKIRKNNFNLSTKKQRNIISTKFVFTIN